ncbi:RNA polymerase sigma factor [Butyrivibrio sp. NC3005]|uniref:RNA polymerase sigma factor n=1 Tax=Butyrivibrio sp. NC3005 TaxID=1280685 RepID=UPI000415083A|nr:RNA polymerase sigma factor [Butyrivibrio sp. NC3005]
MEDKDIIALFMSRQEQAISETEKKYGNYCYKIAWNVLNNEEDSKECVNDTWFKAWNSIPPTIPNFLQSFLGKITRNLSINAWRDKHAQKRGNGESYVILDELSECISDEKNIEQEIIAKELAAKINVFLENMQEDKRKMLVMRYFFMTPVKEIAKKLGISESQVKMTLSRSRKKLQIFLEKEQLL